MEVQREQTSALLALMDLFSLDRRNRILVSNNLNDIDLFGPKRVLLVACTAALGFLLLKRSVQNIEEQDGRPIRVVIQR